MIVLRLKYRKIDYMKFLSHLDMVRLMERSFRRAKLPLEFSQGFNPRPKVNFAAPLSVGVTSDSEVLEVNLLEKIDIEALIRDQRAHFPQGIEIVEGKFIEKENQSNKKLMGSVSSCQYLISVLSADKPTVDQVKKWLGDFVAQEEILIERINKKKKKVQKNIRPAIRSVSVLSVDPEGHVVLSAHLDAGSESNLKAEDLMKALNDHSGVTVDLETLRLHRQKIYAGKEDIYAL
jgi:radical SAM-linked protein